MAVSRQEKVAELELLERAFQTSDSAILIDYTGLDVPAVTELRRQIRAAHASYRVVKNTIAVSRHIAAILSALSSGSQ